MSALPLRVMSWNILEGAHRHREEGQPPTWDYARKHAMAALVRELDPDVLILNEALWAEEADGYRVPYGEWLGYPHMVADVYEGVWGNAILSRFPIVAHHALAVPRRSGLWAALEVFGTRWELVTYHPHPDRRPENKAHDFGALLNLATPDVPFLIAGDFNAINPADHPDLDQLAEGFARFAADPRAAARRFIESGEAIFPVLQARGLRDALDASAGHSIPTDWLSTDKGSAMRIDHLWVNDRVQVVQADILRQGRAERASDHYPICADLLVKTGATS
jgi:endonuclease/exonuclease/phosphatase family metal-dependent hydrolase